MGYPEHRERQQAAAAKEHKEWFKNLTPAQRKKVTHLGLNQGPEDDSEVEGHNPCNVSDIADSPRASVEWDPGDLDAPANVIADEFGVSLPVAQAIEDWKDQQLIRAIEKTEGDLLAIVVGGLIAAKNVKIATAGLAFATKLAALNGFKGQADFARRHNVSRSAISKSTKAWQRDLNIRTSVFQKSEGACETYSQIGRKNHWRAQKTDAVKLLNLLNQTPQK